MFLLGEFMSRSVIFDEGIFPFSNLHPNAGARHGSEITLLHPTLFRGCLFEIIIYPDYII
jgi:hypothetical protein